MEENEQVLAEEIIVLSKFEGEPLPENEIERIHIRNGELVSRDIIKNGQVVSSEVAPGGDLGKLPDRPTPPKKSSNEQEVN